MPCILGTNPGEFWTVGGQFFCLPNLYAISSSGAAVCTDSLTSFLNMKLPPLPPGVQKNSVSVTCYSNVNLLLLPGLSPTLWILLFSHSSLISFLLAFNPLTHCLLDLLVWAYIVSLASNSSGTSQHKATMTFFCRMWWVQQSSVTTSRPPDLSVVRGGGAWPFSAWDRWLKQSTWPKLAKEGKETHGKNFLQTNKSFFGLFFYDSTLLLFS